MNAVCGITGPLGTTTVPCRQSTGGVDFQASLNPGETAFLDATLHFDYRDDGLRLAPGHPGFVQLDAAGDHVRDLFVEAGVIYLFSNFLPGQALQLSARRGRQWHHRLPAHRAGRERKPRPHR